MSDGSNQFERFPSGLAAGAFNVDETLLNDLLSMSRGFAEGLHFRDQSSAVRETWGRLLERDESVLIADARGLRLDHRDVEFLDDYAAGRPGHVVGRLHDLANWLDQWFLGLASIDQSETRALVDRIERLVVQALDPELAAVGLRVAGSISEVCAQIREWLEPIRRQTSRPPGETPSAHQLRVVYFALSGALREVQAALTQELGRSLDSAAHEPAAALLIAFLQVFQRLQERINTFTQRHVDFYYEDCLRLRPRGASADSVHLLMRRDPTFAHDVVVPEGYRFVAGRDPIGRPIEFATTDALIVTDAHVVALKTLRLERDDRISPEREFNFVTRAKIAEFNADVGPEQVLLRDAAPLLGGEVLGCIAREQDARIGLAVSSPILWLKEGERSIDLTLEFNFLGGLSKQQQIDLLLNAKDPPTFFSALGDLFAFWLWSDASRFSLADDDVVAIRQASEKFIDPKRLGVGESADDIATMIDGDALLLLLSGAEASLAEDERRILARDLLCSTLFKVEVSTATGWFEIANMAPQPDRAETSSAIGALGLWLGLSNEDPPTAACSAAVHGAEWPTDAPVLRLTIMEQTRMFPFSLFDRVTLEAVAIDVSVSGLKELRANNQLGQLDASKPFMPFGPLPNTASYLVLGAPEPAHKPVSRYQINLEWAGLPVDGFDQYYVGYGVDFSDDDFTINEFILRDGRWIQSGARTLFDVEHGDLQPTSEIDLDEAALRAHWRPTDAELVFDQNARSGFVKLQLSGPRDGFGQQLYPTALANAMTLGIKRNESPLLPNAPYAPMIERVTIDYAAGTRILVGVASAGRSTNAAERVLHLYPFGVAEVHPAKAGKTCPVLPSLGRDGHLLIGLSGTDLQGDLTLLFELREDTASEAAARRKPSPIIEWSWLADDEWRPLDKIRLIKDTTMGFLTSGVVQLDLPPGFTTGNRVLPEDLYWLRVSSDAASYCFAGLQGVHAQAVCATRVLDEPPVEPLPPNSMSLKGATLPGVLSLRQPSPSFGLRRAETIDQERTRIGERLRHKNRASTPWDYERLVLEAFPSVYKVKCLQNLDADTGAVQPGRVVIVVAPAAPRNDPFYSTRALQLDALQLDHIAAFLPPLASPLARISVRNAIYERIQVRCTVALKRGARFGDVLQRINTALVEYLSPWHDYGYAAGFDWTVRGDDIEACIRAVDEVQSVAGISLIRVWEDEKAVKDSLYFFEDTAAKDGVGSPGDETLAILRPKTPWSLVLPMEEHIIEIVERQRDEGGPRRTGLAVSEVAIASATVPGVQIGTTFVVGEPL
jgi:hypothetical protein